MLEAEFRFTSKALLNILPFPLCPRKTKQPDTTYGEALAGRTPPQWLQFRLWSQGSTLISQLKAHRTLACFSGLFGPQSVQFEGQVI